MADISKKAKLLRRWFNIVMGRSTAAVDQREGQVYSTREIRGYYNDLTGKVTDKTLLDERGIPYNIVSSGGKAYALVTIFQYALGCYDSYLIRKEDEYRKKFLALAQYVLEQQDGRGKWDARASIGSSRGNASCMVQGQGCSILLRAYLLNRDSHYCDAAKKAVDFMLLSTDDGGTAVYEGESIFLEKYPPEQGVHSSVLNGWAYALFGLFDYILYSNSAVYRDVFVRSCRTLENSLSKYDRGYWSNYDTTGIIASPAYHTSHIALLRVIAKLADAPIMEEYAERFEKYDRSRLRRCRAIAVKALQKLTTPQDAFIVQ